MALHCEECGTEVAPDAKFCESCGTRVASDLQRPFGPLTGAPKPERILSSPPERKRSYEWLWAVLLLGALMIVGAVVIPIRSPGSQPTQTRGTPSPQARSDADLINGITAMCKELDVLQNAGKINYWDMWNFCLEHNTFKSVPIAMENRAALEQEYLSARAKFQEIKRKAGLDPNQTMADLEKFKRPTRVLQSVRVFRPVLGEPISGLLTITDVNYKFEPDSQPAPGPFTLNRAQPDEKGFWDLSGAVAQQMGLGRLVETYVYGCIVLYKQGGARMNLSSFYANDSQTTTNLCNTLNQAIQEYNRLHQNVY